jgi:hypothetical protein
MSSNVEQEDRPTALLLCMKQILETQAADIEVSSVALF